MKINDSVLKFNLEYFLIKLGMIKDIIKIFLSYNQKSIFKFFLKYLIKDFNLNKNFMNY